MWFDAVIGYLSAAVEWARNSGNPEAWRDWWQNDESTHAYFMGKDNIVFHTVIWPSMLLGYGSGGELGARQGDLHLPDEVVASEFLTMEGKQLSTSRAIAIYVRDVLERYDPDPVRYFLAAGPETKTATSRGPSFCAGTTTSCSRTGGIWSIHTDERLPEFRTRYRKPAS